MPELPEVETTLRGIAPHIEGKTVSVVAVREPRLRWPVPSALPEKISGQPVERIYRRAKYLLFSLPAGTLLIHLGMSGSLRIVEANALPGKHDHVDIIMMGGHYLEMFGENDGMARKSHTLYRDPRPAARSGIALLLR